MHLGTQSIITEKLLWIQQRCMNFVTCVFRFHYLYNTAALSIKARDGWKCANVAMDRNAKGICRIIKSTQIYNDWKEEEKEKWNKKEMF